MLSYEDGLHAWAKARAAEWKTDPETALAGTASEEVLHRLALYPKVRALLQRRPIEWGPVLDLLPTCWAIGDRFDQIRFQRFVEHGESSTSALTALIESPSSDSVDEFVQTVVPLGYTTPTGGADRAGAAQLASVVLSCARPDMFVDFRRNRWVLFAEAVGYEEPRVGSSYGELLLWAGDCAAAVSQSELLRTLWPSGERRWVVAGVCWGVKDPRSPVPDPPDPAEGLSFPEGREKRRLHLTRERSTKAARLAKEKRVAEDPLMCCDACGFSFKREYGERGAGFIEVHHLVPLAELQPGSRTRLEDLALLCPNCHRMIHQNPMLTVQELQDLIEVNRSGDPA